MECPSCKDLIWCEQCDEHYVADPVTEAPRCQKCGSLYKKTSLLNPLETELNDFPLTVRAAITDPAHNKLPFLKVQTTDISFDSNFKISFSGDVVKFVMYGCGTIEAHRSILAARSSVFHQMFNCGMLEGKTVVIPTDGATYPVMRDVINYCYTTEISFTDEVPPEDVLKVAYTYQISQLVDICVSELCARMNDKNTLEMLKLSKIYGAKLLQAAAAKYFKSNFDAVFSTLLEIV